MRYFPLAALFFLSFLVALGAESSEGFEINNPRYAPFLGKKLIKPLDHLRIPFGKRENQVGGFNEDEKKSSEGIPYAFLPQKDGSVWILDSINNRLKRFTPKGLAMTVIPLEKASDGAVTPIHDFSSTLQDGFYLVCPAEGKIRRINPKGEILVEIEGLMDVWAIGSDPKGNLLVLSPAQNALFRFNPRGEIIFRHELNNSLFPFTDIDGNILGIRGEDLNMSLIKVTDAKPSTEITLARFPLLQPHGVSIKYFSGRVIGVDAAWNIFLELIAADSEGVIYKNQIVKCSPAGKVIDSWEVAFKPFIVPGLPRHLAVTPEGNVMGFYTTEKDYVLFTYPLK